MSKDKTATLCDCERSHNGLGMVGRLCDCQDERPPPPGLVEVALLELESVRHRIQSRVDAMVERDGSIDAAVTGQGVGIGYLFARDIVRTCERGEKALQGFTAGVEQMLAHEDAGGDGWWNGWVMLKAAYRSTL